MRSNFHFFFLFFDEDLNNVTVTFSFDAEFVAAESESVGRCIIIGVGPLSQHSVRSLNSSPTTTMKRSGDNGQLSREEYDALEDDESEAGVYKKASAEKMATRKIVKRGQ